MKTFIIGFFIFITVAAASTTVYLPAGPPWEAFIVSPGCTTATPTVCPVNDATGLAVDDVIGVFGVAASGVTNHMADPRGLLKIKAISGNDITLKTMAGADQGFTGTWEDGGLPGTAAGPQRLRKMTAFTTCDGPKGVFDCWGGTITRSWATGTHNGLVSIVVSSNVATVTLGYDLLPTVVTGVKVTVWNTTSSALSASGGSEYTITVTGARTFTFPITVANGDYTSNPTCGPTPGNPNVIGGTEECVRISFWATSTNWAWTSIQSFTSSPSTIPFDGDAITRSQYGVFCALRVFVDQKAQAYLDYALKHLIQTEQYGGNNFPANDTVNDGGNYALAGQVSNQSTDLGEIYALVGNFLNSTQDQNHRDKVYNDISDPTPCTKVLPAQTAVNSGTAQATDATHITLASGASATNDFYVNNMALADVGGPKTMGRITAYNGTTKQATVTGWDNGTPASNATYIVAATFITAVGTQLTTQTLVGINTRWNTAGPDQLTVGDFIFGVNHWAQFLNPMTLGGRVTAVRSDTDADIFIFAGAGGLVTGTPLAGWITHPWTTGDCGLQWLQAHYGANTGSQPVQYPNWGGTGWRLVDNIGGNLAAFQIGRDLAYVDKDPRAVTSLAKYGILGLDENLELSMSYMGETWSGVNYGTNRAQQGQYQIASALKTIPGFPSLDLTGNWVKGYQAWKQYGLYGDIYGWPRFGDSAGVRPNAAFMGLDYGISFDPTTTSSKYTKYLLYNVLHLNTGPNIGQTTLADFAVRLDPNALTLDYKTQPLQYFLKSTSRTAAMTLGRIYPDTWRGDVFMSRTSWTDTCATNVWINAITFIGDHQNGVQPDLSIWKCGALISNDDMPPGNFQSPGNWVTFDGANSFRGDYTTNGPAIQNITRVSGPLPYGDPGSKAACGTIDRAGIYTVTITRALEYFCHFKHDGDDLVMVYKDVVTPSAHVIADHVYYPQNGQTTLPRTTYPEGTTSYPGTGGCGSLDTNRTVLEEQDGGTSAPISGAGGDTMLTGVSPAPRQYNLVSKFLSPGSITLNCDGTGYAGATGNAERVSIYGGTSVGGTSTTLQTFAAHTILTQPASTLDFSLLSAGTDWVAAQASDSVMVVSSDGTDHNSASFTSTCSGTCQVVMMGMVAGTYTVTIEGTPVAGSPFSVPERDNSLRFTGTGATVIGLQGVNGGGTPVYGGGVIVRGK